MNSMEWEVIPLDEQETILNINYEEKEVSLYTTRKAVAKRLYAKLGEPEIVNEIDGRINSVTYKKSLHDKKIKPIFTMAVLVGGFRKPQQKD